MNSRHFSRYTPLLVTALAGLLFAALMAIRLDLFKSPAVLITPLQSDLSARESWMTIRQGDRKIGYSHRQLSATDTGYQLTDRTVMRITTMGLVQDMDLRTTAVLGSDLSLSAFDASLESSRISFSVHGEVTGDTLVVSTENSQQEIPLPEPIYLASGLWDTAAASELQPGQSIEVPIFDPLSLGSHTIKVTLLGKDAIEIPEGERAAKKFQADFMGVVETAWIDENGTVLKEEGLLGIALVKDTRENATDLATLAGSRDLTLAASIPVGMILDAPATLQQLQLKIDGASPTLLLDGGRQTFSNGILTIVRETLPDPPEISTEAETEFLAATPFIQSDHPEIITAAREAVADAKRPLSKAENLVAWVHDTLEKRPVLSVPSALATLRQGTGDCNEHAVLLAALARAAGIPARVEAGLVYLDGRFYYHAWNSLYLGRWVTADALMNQIPADVTHVRLVRGEAGEQADLLGAIGNLSIQIVGETQ
jgi:hypothetical protein